jgi:hypothetical protein
MTNFYNTDSPAEIFSRITSSEASFTHNFNITETNLKYQFIHVEDNNKILCNISLDLDVLQSQNRFCSQSIFGFEDKELLGSSSDERSITKNDLVSILDETKLNKSSNIFFSGDGHSEIPFRIFVDSESGNFTTFSYIVKSPDPSNGNDIGHKTTVVTNVGTAPTGFTKWKTIFAPVTLSTTQTTVSPGDTILVNVSTTDTSLDKIYISQVTGILDRNVVSLTNGIGSFNILTDSLTSGTTVQVKAGHKLFTNVNTFSKVLA